MPKAIQRTETGYVLQRLSDGEYASYDHGIPAIEAPSACFDRSLFNATILTPRTEMPPEYRELIDEDETGYVWVKVRRTEEIEIT